MKYKETAIFFSKVNHVIKIDDVQDLMHIHL